MRFVYFGGEPIGVPVLEELKACRLIPDLVVTSPDRPTGRKQVLTPPPVKVWAEAHDIPVFQLGGIPKEATDLGPLTETAWDLFVVVAYNHILPQWLIDLPKHQTINLHPSLLPHYRGPSPIRTAILEDNRNSIGVSVMVLDSKMDHGPLLAQQAQPIADEYWPLDGTELDEALARTGGALLAHTIPAWVAGEITPIEQDHSKATYTKKFTRVDGELTIDPMALPRGEAARQALHTIHAFSGYPETFFIYNGKRIKILEADIVEDALNIKTVLPEGKTAMTFETWLKTL
ncbi:MAG: methionyl-tRNA formyltransferase [Candidatus Paceibacterota bacterium]